MSDDEQIHSAVERQVPRSLGFWVAAENVTDCL